MSSREKNLRNQITAKKEQLKKAEREYNSIFGNKIGLSTDRKLRLEHTKKQLKGELESLKSLMRAEQTGSSVRKSRKSRKNRRTRKLRH